MPEDLKKIETLSYVPKCNCVECATNESGGVLANPEQPREGVPVLTADVNGKLLGEKKLRELDEYIKTGCAVKANILIIEEIAGLLSQANEKMYELPIHPIRSKAIEEIDTLQKVTIEVELRKAFE